MSELKRNEFNNLKSESGSLQQDPTETTRAVGKPANALIQQQRDLGIQYYQSGNLPEAEACFQEVLKSQSHNPELWRMLGVIATQQQNFAAAIERFQRSIELSPTDSKSYSALGIVYLKRQEWSAAIDCFRTTIQLQPNDASAHAQLGRAYQMQGMLDEAIAAYQNALKLQPNSDPIHIQLGTIYEQKGLLDRAVASYRRALQLRPTLSPIHAKLGQLYQGQGNIEEASASYRHALQLQPEFYQAHANLGNVLKQQGKLDEAIVSYQRTLQLQPDDPETLSNLGTVYHAQGKLDEAIANYQRALQLRPNFCEACNNLGNALKQQGKLDEAISSFQCALQLQPALPETLNNLGTAYQAQGKLADAFASYQQALQLQPVSPETHNNLGNVYQQQGKLEDAISSYQRALQLQSDFPSAFINLGNVYKQQGRVDLAIACYEQALTLQSDNPEVLQEYVWTRRGICSWDGLTELERSLVEALRSDPSEQWAPPPFPILAMEDDPEVQLAAAQNFCAKYVGSAYSPLWNGERYPHKRIRLAYLSADFHEHATAYLMAELFERHDRSQFEVCGLSFGPNDGSPMRQRLEQAFDRFIDIRRLSHGEAARHIRDLEIDIAIDLKGYTQDCRPQIFAHRPAPIQVNYLGYPGTMGADFIDYILVDPFVVPPYQQPFFTEKLVHLPDCYQVNDGQRAIDDVIPTRQACGLPAQDFVFCSFNNSNKITPAIFDVWMRLLKAVPNSVLWLLARNSIAEDNLRLQASARDIKPNRLVFAPPKPLSEHLSRQRLADLFLDTLPYNAHTTTSDALWAGLPVLTCAGRSFAARVAGSLLHTIGLPKLVTHTLDEYEALAFKLATQPDALRQIQCKLMQNIANTPLFDSDRFRHNVEAAYTHMWAAWQQGDQPKAFFITP
ncbi:MAG: tetratricopeptide repeat protein [Cyanobacteria bacterium P01_E01_bin.34]